MRKTEDIYLMTVFIPRENIFFLKEWIQHHLSLGVRHIFLYDNGLASNETRSPAGYIINPICERHFISGLTKHGEDYRKFTSHWTDKDISGMTREIIEKFPGKVSLIPWRPRDEEGRIIYGQIQAFIDYLKKSPEGTGTLLSDIDEFLWTAEGYSFVDLVSKMDSMGCVCITLDEKRF